MVYNGNMTKVMQELREKGTDELAKLLAEKREAVRGFRFGMKGSRTRNTKACRTLRRDIARILFLLGTGGVREKSTA